MNNILIKPNNLDLNITKSIRSLTFYIKNADIHRKRLIGLGYNIAGDAEKNSILNYDLLLTHSLEMVLFESLENVVQKEVKVAQQIVKEIKGEDDGN